MRMLFVNAEAAPRDTAAALDLSSGRDVYHRGGSVGPRGDLAKADADFVMLKEVRAEAR